MKPKKTEFQITIGYRAIICFTIKAENEDDAKAIALEKVKVDGI